MKKYVYLYITIVILVSIYLIWFLQIDKKYYSLLFVSVIILSILPKIFIKRKNNFNND